MGCTTSSLNVKAEKGIEKSIKSELKISVKYRQVGDACNTKMVGNGGFTPKSNSCVGSRNPGKKPQLTKGI